MTVSHVEVLVEEPSMEAALQEILPRILGSISFGVYPHQGKRDLLEKLPARLMGYAAWITSEYRIVVVVDRDDDDCRTLKRGLERAARDARLATRSTASAAAAVRVIPRIVVEELEAWYFGDWAAVRAAYPSISDAIPMKAAYRDPDAIRGGTWEAFERIAQDAGCFAGGLRKIEAARAIGKHMDPARSTSQSFRCLRDALLELI